jgi:hypothetical protein
MPLRDCKNAKKKGSTSRSTEFRNLGPGRIEGAMRRSAVIGQRLLLAISHHCSEVRLHHRLFSEGRMRLRHLQTFLPYAILGAGLLVIVATFLRKVPSVRGLLLLHHQRVASLAPRWVTLHSSRELIRPQARRTATRQWRR